MMSRPLNQGNWAKLLSLASLYAKEKDRHLVRYYSGKMWWTLGRERAAGDALMSVGFAFPSPARYRKLAHKDAVDTLIRHIEPGIETGQIRQQIYVASPELREGTRGSPSALRL